MNRRLRSSIVIVAIAVLASVTFGQAVSIKDPLQTNECPACHGTTPKQGKYCMHCGRKLPARTGATVFPTKTFCLACGAFAFGARGACDQCGSTSVRVVNYVVVDGKAASNVVKCRQCGTAMRKGAKYCPDCGTRASAVPRTKKQVIAAKCTNCGTALRTESVFCPNCGLQKKK